MELFNGNKIVNTNKGANPLKCKFYVCPICGNIITSMGEVNTTCCGVSLVEEESELINGQDNIKIIDGKLNFKVNSPMTKENYITFVAYVTFDQISIVKLYPEQECEVNFEVRGSGYIYFCNNNSGLYKIKF